jgi:hypothetical protein
MNSFTIIISLLSFFVVLVLIFWFRGGRKKYTAFIKPPNPLPKHGEYNSEWFADKTPTRTVWRVTEAETQPNNNVECVAFSLHELMQSPPLNQAAPGVGELFKEIGKRDDQKNNEFGANPIGAMKYLEQKGLVGIDANLLTNILRRFGFCHAFFNFTTQAQLIEYVKTYAPVIGGMPIYSLPAINDEGVLYAMSGEFAFDHSILIFGVDEDFLCPDGNSGAFRVRWHLPFFGQTDGWIPFTLADRLFNKGWCYGFNLGEAVTARQREIKRDQSAT